MPLPSSGQISLGQVADITQANPIAEVSLNDPLVRTLFEIPTGQISLANGYGKPVANSTSYVTNGNYSYVVPVYQYITADVRGPGGGGGGGGAHWLGVGGGNGGGGGSGTPASSFNATVVGNAGAGGAGGLWTTGGTAASGAAGTASGGDTNTTGGGSSGGPGGNGSNCGGAQNGGTGGAGGRAVKTWRFAATSGYFTWGSTVSVVVGNGGGGGGGGFASVCSGGPGTAGTKGAVYITTS